MDELKKACEPYYSATETKEIGDGEVMYKTVGKAGVKLLSLGYFPSEELAVEALYNYLVNNGMIQPIA